MQTDRRKFIGGGLATFVGILAGRLPSSPPGTVSATLELEDNFTPALERITEALQPVTESIDRVRLSLDGCRDIFITQQRVINEWAGNDGLMCYQPGLTSHELQLEFWPPYPVDDVVRLLAEGTEVEIDCRAVDVPAEIHGLIKRVDRGLHDTRVIVLGTGEIVWHG